MKLPKWFVCTQSTALKLPRLSMQGYLNLIARFREPALLHQWSCILEPQILLAQQWSWVAAISVSRLTGLNKGSLETESVKFLHVEAADYVAATSVGLLLLGYN